MTFCIHCCQYRALLPSAFYSLLCWLIAEFICLSNLSCLYRVNLACLFSKGAREQLYISMQPPGFALSYRQHWHKSGHSDFLDLIWQANPHTHIIKKTSIQILLKVSLCVWLYRAFQHTRRALVSSICILHTYGHEHLVCLQQAQQMEFSDCKAEEYDNKTHRQTG